MGAPIVMSIILSMETKDYQPEHQVQFLLLRRHPQECFKTNVGGSFLVTHLYGLTETYGPAVINEWNHDWDDLDMTSQTSLKARQGAISSLEHLKF